MEVTRRTGLALLVAASVLVAGAAVFEAVWIRPPDSTMPGSTPDLPQEPVTGTPAPPPSDANVSATRLAFSLVTDRRTYAVGDTVNVSITLTNVGTRTITLGLPNPCSVVFLVYDGGAQVVFNSTRYWGCIEVWWDLVLAPGASQVWSYSWTLITDHGTPVPAPASYRIVPSFTWGGLYQDDVVRTETATIDVGV